MVTRFSHTTLYVNDQDKAYDFYVNILGFKVHTDAKMDNGFRWLTVTAPEAPELEIVLMPALHESMKKSEAMPEGLDEETMNAFKVLLEKGVLGAGVLETPDCRATYEELKAKGVKFRGEPKEQFYGIEAVMHDGCGNWFSLTQPKQMPEDGWQ
jgi:catechol 2,3-dioxygenase-like lactoylglutathione lyase family enzyme